MTAATTDVLDKRAGGSPRRTSRASLRGRLAVLALEGLSGLLWRLPDAQLHRLAHAFGTGVLYRLQPARRELVRSNLGWVCRYLLEQRLVPATSPAGRAASHGRALERLVRQAFGHYVRAYLETAIVGGYARRGQLPRLEADEPAQVEHVFGGHPAPGPRGGGRGRRALIVVGMHFGAIEIPGLWASARGLRVTAPMETLVNRHLQAYLERSRGASGLRLVPVSAAAPELAAALARGEVVALVADRVVSGSGARVPLFGRAARLPVGPAALAVASGAPAWLVTTRRVGWASYRVQLQQIEPPAEGTRRERLARFLEAEATAFERAVALAPEQWWTLFFPIWQEDRR